MSKISKLIKSPGLYFRDLLIKRYPISINQRVPIKSLVETDWDKVDERKIVSTNRPVPFPIDVVITYVDGSTPEFLEQLSINTLRLCKKKSLSTDRARFECHDELKYCLRSILKYAPWVNKIYVVSDSQIPNWFNKNQEKVQFIDHREIIDARYLPTFNSHVIESCLHKIPNLSEHYLYFNDDMFLSRHVSPEYFFGSNGLAFYFQSDVILQNSPISEIYDTPTEWGAKNGRALIFDEFGFHLSEMFAHTLYPQRRSVAEHCEELFSDIFEEFRGNKFRDISDVLCTGFLFPHVANILGKGLYTRTRVSYFNIRMPGSRQNYHWLASVKGTPKAPFSFCVNDRVESDGSSEYDYMERYQEFMDFYFPEQSLAEI